MYESGSKNRVVLEPEKLLHPPVVDMVEVPVPA
jgi:hypothetical protein